MLATYCPHSKQLEAHFPQPKHSLLDVGCSVGLQLRWAYERGFGRLYGIDIDPKVVEMAKKQLGDLHDKVTLFHGCADYLPLDNDSVDTVIFFEVLEHIPEDLRPTVIGEIHRVLRPGGRLIMTTPHKGLFHFLDPDNLRFRVPGVVYRFINKLVGGQSKDAGYVGQKHGVVWHHHFSLQELNKLLYPRFDVKAVRGRGCLLFPLCQGMGFPLYRRRMNKSPLMRILDAIKLFDVAIAWPLFLAFNVLVVADKKVSAGSTAQ